MALGIVETSRLNARRCSDRRGAGDQYGADVLEADTAMRLFLDSNIVTYLAVFEPFLIEGSTDDLHECASLWLALQGGLPDAKLRREIEALRILYLVDDRAHFDWLCSDHGVAEIQRIRNVAKREAYGHLLTRLIQHREDVYAGAGDTVATEAVEARRRELFPTLPPRMESDALQFCEAELLNAYFFLTNDRDFARVAAGKSALGCCPPSELPFVTQHLTGEIEHLWEDPR